MNRIPRLLPLAAVAIGGVLVVKTLAGFELLPDAIAGARAFAEEAAKETKASKAEAAKSDAGKADAGKSEPFKIAAATLPPAPKPTMPAAVCAPTAADLAKDAGLSPAELQVLQSLGARRGQLDARERDMDVQLRLLAAAEAKLDAKLKTMTGLKAQIAALIGEADKKEDGELDRLVTVYQKMKPREAAAVMTQLDDKVRVPVAAKMKEAALAAILQQMPPLEAKKLTESLAQRFAAAKALAVQSAAPPIPAATPAPAQAPAKGAAPKPAAKPAAPSSRASAPAAATPAGEPPKAAS